MKSRFARSAFWPIPALLALALIAASRPAAAQTPTARVPNPYERSGLLTRQVRVLPKLPPDPDRDSFQGSRYADEQDGKFLIVHPNDSWRRGGMYGYPLSDRHMATVAPYFMGSPGSTIGPDTRNHNPVTTRWVKNLFYPFQPVGMYYDRGVYAPIYDFDWFVPGPGPFPWPHFFIRPTGG